jgi:hypothetical protein
VSKDAQPLSRPRKSKACGHVFQSQETPELFGFTVDETGGNLPPEGGPWERVGIAIPLGVTMASTSPEIGRQIERAGYALVQGHSVSPPRLRRGDSTP